MALLVVALAGNFGSMITSIQIPRVGERGIHGETDPRNRSHTVPTPATTKDPKFEKGYQGSYKSSQLFGTLKTPFSFKLLIKMSMSYPHCCTTRATRNAHPHYIITVRKES